MSMYRSYLLKNEFWAKKNCTDDPVYIKHDNNGGIYATIIHNDQSKGVEIMVDGDKFFFNNFDKLDFFLNEISHRQDNFVKILKRKNISQKLRKLDI
jgi:hypothetical protein